jgi:hypothetical protein
MEMLDTSEVNGNEMSLRTQILKRSDREARTPGYDDQDTALLIENICASSGGKTLGDIPMHLSYRLKRNGSQARLSGAQLSHYDQGAEYTLPYFSREHSQRFGDLRVIISSNSHLGLTTNSRAFMANLRRVRPLVIAKQAQSQVSFLGQIMQRERNLSLSR